MEGSKAEVIDLLSKITISQGIQTGTITNELATSRETIQELKELIIRNERPSTEASLLATNNHIRDAISEISSLLRESHRAPVQESSQQIESKPKAHIALHPRMVKKTKRKVIRRRKVTKRSGRKLEIEEISNKGTTSVTSFFERCLANM